MTEQLLHHADICPIVKQMRRKAVTEHVRVDTDAQLAALTLLLHQVLYAPGRSAAAHAD